MRYFFYACVAFILHYLSAAFINYQFLTLETLAEWGSFERFTYLSTLFAYVFFSFAIAEGNKKPVKSESTLPAGL